MSIAVVPIVLGLIGLLFAVGLAMRAGRGSGSRERDAGLAAMRELSWKDFGALVVRAFETRGYKRLADARKPGDEGADHMLERAGHKHVLQVKHGGAYRVGVAAVRRLLTLIDQHQAAGGILATSGEFDAAAREAARRQPVVLLEGDALWQQVGPLLPASAVVAAQARVADQEAAGRRRVLLGCALSLVLVLAGVALIVMRPAERAAAPKATPAAAAPTVAATPTPEQPRVVAEQPSPAATPAAARTPPPPATEAELAVQRELIAANALLVEGVVSATWPTKSTLLVSVRGGDPEKRAAIIKGICASILPREELRFTRLQVYDFNVQGDAEQNVRFTQCK